MYISGLTNTYQSRLHQLPTVTGDILTGFLREGNSIITGFCAQTSGQFERELRLKMYQMTASGGWLATQMLSGNGPSLYP